MKEYKGYDAEAKKSFEAEMTTIKKFIQSAKTHENIATTIASLEWGNTYSLFFDLAKCNLWEYFKENGDTVRTLEEKRIIFGRTIGLAGALAYLHDDLYLASTGEQLQCYHLDLKPQNILVFEENGDELWKISDFGISQIKRIPPNRSHAESEHHISFLDRIFKSKIPDPSSGVDNSRYGGTYAAPEAKEKSDTVTRKSDVWSLACIVTLVLTFLHKQSQGIAQFQKSRARDRSHDWFFDSKALKPGSENKEILHSSVVSWLEYLDNKAMGKDQSEAKATREAIALLRKMFLRDQEERLSARDVERELKAIQSWFVGRAESSPEEITRPKGTNLHKFLHHTHELLHSIGSHKITKSRNSWLFDIPHTSRRCKFSTDGRYLCIGSDEVMVVRPILGLQQEQAGTPVPSPGGKQWADFSLGSKYLCAALDSEYFEVYLLPRDHKTGSHDADFQ